MDDDVEHAADARARAALVLPVPRTDSLRTQLPTAATALPGLGVGQPLSLASRAFLEPRFGADLTAVRLHTDGPAAMAAVGLGARAFSREGHIGLGPGQGDDADSLLAHEIGHVVEGHTGLRRQATMPGRTALSPGETLPGQMPMASGPVCEPEAAGEVCSIDDPIAIEHPHGYNPCSVDVTRLTNYELLGEYNVAVDVTRRGRATPGYLDFRNLQRRLVEERDRRTEMGHAWLAGMPQTLPLTVYQVLDNPDGTFTVNATTGFEVAGMPQDVRRTPLMTRSQFDRFLETHNVDRVDGNTYRLRVEQEILRAAGVGATVPAGGLHRSLADVRMTPGFAVSPTSNTWQGRMGELSFTAQPQAGFGYAIEDLNALSWINRRGAPQNIGGTQANYPVMDYQRVGSTRGSNILGIQRFSVKAPMSSNVASRMSTYAKGLATIYESGQSGALRSYIANQPEFAQQPLTGSAYEANRSSVIGESSMAVNSDDLARVRRLLSDPTVREAPSSSSSVWNQRAGFANGQPRAGWREAFAGAMREQPAKVNSQVFTTPDALDNALANKVITGAEHRNAQREVGERLASKVVSHGTSTTDLAIMRTRRAAISLTDAQLAPLITPEAVSAARLGELPAGLMAGGRAGVSGATIGVVTTLGVMFFDEEDHPNWPKELGLTGALGGGGAAAGGFTEQLVVSTGTQMAMRSVEATGASTLSRAGIQGLGRFGGGAVGAMFVEGVGMGLLEEREHSGVEVGVRLARSGIVGGASIWTGAAVGTGVGTAIGGPIGAAVGFIVGLGVGAGVYYLGDKLVPLGKEDWDAAEAGCRLTLTPLPVTDPSRRFCFVANTPVALADGRTCPIRDLEPGELVLSYNERTLTVEPRRVLHVHSGSAARTLTLSWSGGLDVHVTPEHPMATTAGWVRAGSLVPGDLLLRLDGDGVAPAVLDTISSAAHGGRVYDLEIDTTHTYFAEGLLAHNKIY
ncbi:eCIS core domain-containing protein [Streptomyces phaeochromogenes]|uniref:eCIS core domain-containing protein n=1 Tax=Streptomyces phaeochromogenes TaxID=1923 RepID=UPI002E100007|nr:DUF4157 domain-containing protein [Streptomyces phaeochromogenes]